MKQPNFLLIVTDQQRADHIGCYGNRVVNTRNLDHLAGAGWRAERCYVASPICMPNRASLLTGRLPSVHRARHNGIPLPLTEVTLADRLRAAGYATALVGKAHLQNISGKPAAWPRPVDPRTEGEARRPEAGRFDQEWGPAWRDDPSFAMALPYYGFEHMDLVIDHGDVAGGNYRRWLEANHPDVAALTGPAHAIPTPDFELSRCGQAWRTRVPEELSTTSYVGMQTCRELDRFAASGKPFFLQCSFPDPHHPFTPPGRFWDLHSPDDIELPASHAHPGGETGPTPHLDWLRRERAEGRAIRQSPSVFAATEREVREAIALNYGSIAHIDEAIGSVLSRLDQLGLANDTVVIFTSDHGDYFGDHGLLWKGPLHYQGLVRVPLIWRDPDLARPGVAADLCSTIDIASTILERAGCSPHNGLQGLSLLPSILRGEAIARDAILIEEEGQRCLFGLRSRTRLRTLQTLRWRLSVYDEAPWGELYDLDADPGENHNLWDAAADVRHDLMHKLVQCMTHYADASPNPTALA
jgi:arylsulfatase